MTSQSQNRFAKQVEARQNLDRLASPGVRADHMGRNIQTVGVVRADTLDIADKSYVADVDVTTPYGNTAVTIPRVRFNVPVDEGDVVSLTILGGNPRNGVFGTPIRPKGPNVVHYAGPTDAAGWSADQNAPASQRAINATMQSYVIPVNAVGSQVNAPASASTGPTTLFTLPEKITIQTIPSAAYVEIAGNLNAGLRVARSGGMTTNHAIRFPGGQLRLKAVNDDPDVGQTVSMVATHNGLASAAARFSPLTRFSYVDMGGYPLISTGQHILFVPAITDHPVAVGKDFTLSVEVTVPSVSGLQYLNARNKRDDGVPTEVRYFNEEEMFDHQTPPTTTGSGGNPSHSHQINHASGDLRYYDEIGEYEDHTPPLVWEDLPAPISAETYYIWLGLNNVTVTIVEMGTGSGFWREMEQ